jgi:hypothetical protein
MQWTRLQGERRSPDLNVILSIPLPICLIVLHTTTVRVGSRGGAPRAGRDRLLPARPVAILGDTLKDIAHVMLHADRLGIATDKCA